MDPHERALAVQCLGQRPSDGRVGGRYFLVTNRWFQLWQHNANAVGADTIAMPPTVDNSPLLEDKPSGSLRLRLVHGFDYNVVDEETWGVIKSKYGGGPEICRVLVVNGRGQLELDVYPVLVKLCVNNDRVWVDSLTETFLMSRWNSFSQLNEYIKNALAQRGVLLGEYQLYGGLYGSDFELIRFTDHDTMASNIGDSKWCNAASVIRVLLCPKQPRASSQKRSHNSAFLEGAEVVNEDVSGRKRKGSAESRGLYAKHLSAPVSGAVRGPIVAPPPASAFAPVSGKVQGAAHFNTSRQNEAPVVDHGNGIQAVALGACGLANMGNTCFINAIMQCLNQSQQLVKWLINEQKLLEATVSSKENQGKPLLIRSFANVVRMLWNMQHSVVTPVRFLNDLGCWNPTFVDGAQHDAHALLIYMLDRFDVETNQKLSDQQQDTPQEEEEGMSDLEQMDMNDCTLEKAFALESSRAWDRSQLLDSSPISTLFRGQYGSSLQCEVCGHNSVKFEICGVLSLPIFSLDEKGVNLPDMSTSLDRCLQHFSSTEHLDPEEQWRCPNCEGLRPATKKITLIQNCLPEILVFQLKRFNAKGEKIDSLVNFPVENLDMDAYSEHISHNNWERKSELPSLYDLFAITSHTGSLVSGHYTATVRCSDHMWRRMDDSTVTTLPYPPDGSDSDAYLLFYQRKSIP